MPKLDSTDQSLNVPRLGSRTRRVMARSPQGTKAVSVAVSGWWLTYPFWKNDGVRQFGMMKISQYDGKSKSHVPNHQPGLFFFRFKETSNEYSSIFPSDIYGFFACFLHFVLVEFALHAFITEPWEKSTRWVSHRHLVCPQSSEKIGWVMVIQESAHN